MIAVRVDPERAINYSPLSFLRELREQCVEHVQLALDQSAKVIRSAAGGALYYRRLAWDSEFFGTPFYRIEWLDLAGVDAVGDAAGLLVRLRHQVAADSARAYVSAEVPAEDNRVLQALGLAGFRLIETRATYYTEDVATFNGQPRWPVRRATADDIPELRAVAAASRNAFDRYHADPFFGEAEADRYLAAYAEASVRGFADLVLVPDDPIGAPAGAFFTATISTSPACPLGIEHACSFDLGLGRIPLVAVSGQRSGWHVRLLTEMTHLFREQGLSVAAMTTQATNRAVIRNCEKVGYRFGRLTHVFAWSPAIGMKQ